MTAPAIFDYSGQQVRTVLIDGEPWFVAADVCRVLEIGNVSMAVGRLDEDGVSTAEVIDSMGRGQRASVISEAALYELVFQSRKPEARDFRRWVTQEVLPQIRRTGGYGGNAQLLASFDPMHNVEHLSLLVQAGHAALERVVAAEAKVAELEPAAGAWDTLAADAGDFSIREAAQVLSRDETISIGQNRLFGYLREIHWIDQTNAPYQSQVDNGRLVRRVTDWTDDFGQRFVKVQPRVTAKGLAELRKRLGPGGGLALVPGGAA